jgi:hypothetical protein
MNCFVIYYLLMSVCRSESPKPLLKQQQQQQEEQEQVETLLEIQDHLSEQQLTEKDNSIFATQGSSPKSLNVPSIVVWGEGDNYTTPSSPWNINHVATPKVKTKKMSTPMSTPTTKAKLTGGGGRDADGVHNPVYSSDNDDDNVDDDNPAKILDDAAPSSTCSRSTSTSTLTQGSSGIGSLDSTVNNLYVFSKFYFS